MDEQDGSGYESVSSDISHFAPDYDEFAILQVSKGPLKDEEIIIFLKRVKSAKKVLSIAQKFTPDIPGLVKQLKPLRNNPLLQKRQQQRVRLLIKRLDPDEPLLLKKMISLFLFSFAMALTFATLNTGGCSEELNNLSVRTYVDFTLHNPDVVLLQETYNLTEHSSCWEHWPYRVHCAQGDSRGTGVTTLIKKNCDFNIITCSTIFNNYILYLKIKSDSTIYHVYNFLIPQKDSLAFECIRSFHAHCTEQIITVLLFSVAISMVLLILFSIQSRPRFRKLFQ